MKKMKKVVAKMYKNPYFTNVPNIGNLDLEEILVEDDIPVFFTLISENKQRYISVCCEIYGEQRWIIAPVSNDRLIELLTNKLSIRDIFLNNEGYIIVHWSKDNPTLRYETVDPHEPPEDDLPLNEMLDTEKDEFSEYITEIQKEETK